MRYSDQPSRGRRKAEPAVPRSTTTSSSAAMLTERPRDAARRARQRVQQEQDAVRAPAKLVPAVVPPFPLDLAGTASATGTVPAQLERRKVELRHSQGRRSDMRRAKRQSAPRAASQTYLAQRGSIAVAAAGLALAVIVPTTAASSDPATESAASESLSFVPVSADGSASVDFDGAAGASKNDPDTKLKDALKVSASKVSPVQSKGTLRAPLDQLQTTSPFGYRVNPITGAMGELHTGQDFAAGCGTPVYAAAGGTVSFAAWHAGGGGNRVEIDHGNGLSTSYNHNSVVKVRQGQKVKRGDLVALSGTTGASTGCHVHFEVMVDKQTVDPMNWL